jgi:flagella basal body P-ring formation protein FlgA
MLARTHRADESCFARLLQSLLAVCALIPVAARSDEPSATYGAASKQAADVVIVSVNPVADTTNREVTIAEVATVEGGDTELRKRIANLDLADAPRFGQSVMLTQELIAYRIQLAGIDSRRYQIQGARSAALTLRSYQVPEKEIVNAARQFLLTRLPWPANDLAIEPNQPIRGPVHVPGGRADVRFEVSFPASKVSLGRVRVDIAIFSNGEKQVVVPVSFDVRLYQTIAVASRRVERGQPLTNDSIFYERRAVDTVGSYLTETESPVGQRAKRLIMPLQIVTKSDVEPVEPDTPVVVKQRDAVQLVARAGDLIVTASGEALQDGRTGQMIRVRNVDSKTVVTGRVVSRSEVRVLY